MDIQEQIRQLVNEHRVVLFMKGSKQFPQCGFSARAVQLLQAAGCQDFVTVNVLENEAVRQGIKEFADWPTIPQLYVDGEFQGGCDIMTEMFEAGELQTLLGGAA
ncbi:Grx4 family monothiol glutaredoxin [Conchiformibius kuhniae]|uniref:Glutaredoxin n=1 Tax=Conchiformibius kuhniae TaxID=211502 RepID=A0A8T9MTX5_9NEIS|nr:Grx4 family monothiol glutaredoxin [Conchiformibius kuhniae]